MTRVNTPLGAGQVVESTSSHGKTSHLVEGSGFSRWFEAKDVFFFDDVEHLEDNVVDEENTTTLPYNPNPQVSPHTLPDEATLQPIYEIDEEERLQDTDSLDVHTLSKRLGPKFVKLKESAVDRDSALGRMTSDPERYAREVRGGFERVAENTRLVDFFYLMDSDKVIRESAWKDVRAKANRLRREGAVNVQELTPRAIHAIVQGDNGVYDTVVVRGGATIGSGSITEWACSCPWGQHAFTRKHTYVGRLCSHAYAAYMELQAKGKMDFNPDTQRRDRRKTPLAPALLPTRYQSKVASELDGYEDRYAGLNVEVQDYYPETHYLDRVDLEEDERGYSEYDPEDDHYKVGAVDQETGYYTQIRRDSEGNEMGVIYDPLDREVDTFYPQDGLVFDYGEDSDSLSSFVSDLSDEDAYGFRRDFHSRRKRRHSTSLFDNSGGSAKKPFSGSGWREPLIPETSKERAEREDEMEDVTELSGKTARNLRVAGRTFSFQEQMDLINEALGDDEVLGRLDLRGTHYEL